MQVQCIFASLDAIAHVAGQFRASILPVDCPPAAAACRPWMQACLFDPTPHAARVDSLLQSCKGKAEATAILQDHAPVEVALHAATGKQWERCVMLKC